MEAEARTAPASGHLQAKAKAFKTAGNTFLQSPTTPGACSPSFLPALAYNIATQLCGPGQIPRKPSRGTQLPWPSSRHSLLKLGDSYLPLYPARSRLSINVC